MAMVARLFVTAPGERRQDNRRSLGVGATLRVARAAPRDVVILDLSASGCQFVSSKPIPLGSSISVGIAGIGVREAKIVRYHGGWHGCAFEQPLNAAERERAGRIDTVRSGHFPAAAQDESVEPTLAKYAGVTRLALLVGSATAAWVLLIVGVTTIW